jgi:hypothetical protein
MQWDLTGKRIHGNYLGIEVQGVVQSSRVKLGGKVVHYVKMDTLKMIHGTLRDVVSMYTNELTVIGDDYGTI